MPTPNTYSLADLEGALRACNNAVIQTRRGLKVPILNLAELKNDADALSGLVVKARAQPTKSLAYLEIGILLPKLAYWQRRSIEPPPSRSDVLHRRALKTTPPNERTD